MENCIQPPVINAAKTHNRPCSPEAYTCVVYARPTSLLSCGERHAIAWYLPDPSSSGPEDGAGLGLGSRLLQCGHSGRRVVRMWRSTQRGQIEKLGKQAACVPLTAADRRPHDTQAAIGLPRATSLPCLSRSRLVASGSTNCHCHCRSCRRTAAPSAVLARLAPRPWRRSAINK